MNNANTIKYYNVEVIFGNMQKIIYHSFFLSPQSFWSAARITTFGWIQFFELAQCVLLANQIRGNIKAGQRSRFLVLSKRIAASGDAECVETSR